MRSAGRSSATARADERGGLHGYAERLRGFVHAAELVPNADYWVGIEGGVEDKQGSMSALAWVVVMSKNLMGKGRTGTFFLPDEVANLVREGKELGEADDLVFNRKNSKQSDGAIGLLTGNVIDRSQLYEEAVILALIPFKNVEMYEKK